jgi:hypothetical protein
MDGENVLRNFWTPLFVYSSLLGIYLIIFGIALAGLVAALNKQDGRDRGQDN